MQNLTNIFAELVHLYVKVTSETKPERLRPRRLPKLLREAVKKSETVVLINTYSQFFKSYYI